ncbi:MAG: ferredoxin [Acidimicrobiia bacterium]
MKVWIDQAACIGNGICAELAADVFKFDGEYAYVRDGDRVLKDRGAMVMVRHGREDVVLDAAEECPAACIHIEGA